MGLCLWQPTWGSRAMWELLLVLSAQPLLLLFFSKDFPPPYIHGRAEGGGLWAQICCPQVKKNGLRVRGGHIGVQYSDESHCRQGCAGL